MFKFNLKLFLYTVILGLTVEMFIGTTYAVFTASTSVRGNVFLTGNWTSNSTSFSQSSQDIPTTTPLIITPTDTPIVTPTDILIPTPTLTVMLEPTNTITPTPG